jgi:hypothetical protein
LENLHEWSAKIVPTRQHSNNHIDAKREKRLPDHSVWEILERLSGIEMIALIGEMFRLLLPVVARLRLNFLSRELNHRQVWNLPKKVS